MNTKNSPKFQSISTYFARHISAYSCKFLSISIFFYLFLSFSLFAQQDNLEVKGKIETDSLTVRGGASFPASAVKGEVFYRDDENKYYVFDGSNWQEIGAGIDRTVASQIVGTTSSIYDADQICDGTSDQVEIQQAIDDLGDNKGSVRLLEGSYNLNGSIALNNTSPLDSNKSIIGAGAGTMLKIAAGAANVNVIYPHRADNTLISQLRIDGSSRTGSNNFGVYVYSKNCIVDNLWIADMEDSGILLRSYSDNIVNGSYISGNGISGITYSGWPKRNIIAMNNIQNTQHYSVGSGSKGILSYGDSIISANLFHSNEDVNIYMEGSRQTILGNNVHYSSGGSTYGVLIGNNYHIIAGNYISASGYGTTYGSNSVISSNVLYSNDYGFWSSSSDFTFFGNLIYENGASSGNCPGINLQTYFGATPKRGLISSNLIYDSIFSGTGNYNYGIWINQENDLYLAGNLIFGSAYYAPTASPPVERRVKDAGTSTRYTDKLKITLQEGEYTHTGNTISLSGPASYLRLNHSSNITVNTIQKTAGTFAVGDILILENTTAHRVILNEAGNFCLHTSPLNLYQNDTLALVYDGTNWIETGYSDN